MPLNKIVLSFACCSTLYDQNHTKCVLHNSLHWDPWILTRGLRSLHLQCTYSVLGVHRNVFTRSPADDLYWASLIFTVVMMLYTLPYPPSSIITAL